MWKLNFETVTPLHISNGTQLAYNLEYIEYDSSLAKLNLNNASKTLVKANLFDFKQRYNYQKLSDIIQQNKEIFSYEDFEYQIDVLDSFNNFLNNEKKVGQKIVQEFINSKGNFYIPGSSIKGMLTTVLRRDLSNRYEAAEDVYSKPLGINPKSPSIKDKFVITDSEYISEENFIVDRVDRPPAINLITLDIGVQFSSFIKSKGNLSLDELKNSLRNYSKTQIEKALKCVERYKQMEKKPKGATNFHKIIETMLNEMDFNENYYFVNLGFGGGSYFKINHDTKIPKFPNPGRNKRREEAHTTFNVNIDGDLFQLGWCKLKIEEI